MITDCCKYRKVSKFFWASLNIQLNVNDLIDTRTDPGRLLTLWVSGGV